MLCYECGTTPRAESSDSGICTGCYEPTAREQHDLVRQLVMPWGERSPARLVRERAAQWSLRSDKWHRVLETERAWSWRGAAWPALIAAASALAGYLHPEPLISLCAAVVIAAVGVRLHAARTRLDAGKAQDAWVSADRVSAHYEGVLARLDAGGDEAQALAESQRIESVARFGVPEALRDALAQVTR